ncbi:aldehyde dehydrogenase [Bacillus sp. PK3-056]|uniref:Aldehyde dehydrogenase n=1 Tax=Niallia circulans TaxID=1397 RepID=A0AA91Z0X1_NIACI|nr:aldehyde dehydrogenase [Niallia circulans]AYV73921.1 aldehyde dehydrogenase [Niallia circulans]PAD83004.1 aldehyde dehydrogenase [Niallia circulans]UQZ76240.1 aldehyde dehydrogenase [Niallia circulans]
MEVNQRLEQTNSFFSTQATLPLAFRIEQLEKLKNAILEKEPLLIKALQKDLGKHPFESYASEIGFVLQSIRHTKRHLKRWMKPQKAKSTWSLFPSRGKTVYEPYGTVLIIGPFNYPFQLLIEPLIGAIAAGNCAILKPSELVPTVSAVVTDMINNIFEPAYISAVEGGIETNQALIQANFDYIFFTGSTKVGKIVMEAASQHLTPVTLELGGKSPVIIDETANLNIAAKRIIWGKTLNAGQTCVAPDYIMVHESVKEPLIAEMKKTLGNYFGEEIEDKEDFGRIVSDRHFQRLIAMLEADRKTILFGGKNNRDTRFIEPTLLDATWDSATMQEEIFGPLLPILTYTNLDEAMKSIRKLDKPLALYLFTNNKETEAKVIRCLSSGGVCINDVLTHIVPPSLPFGGVGASGMGAYHGKYSFKTFSHQKSILRKSTKVDIPFLFPPYTKRKEKVIRKVLK